MKCMSLRTLACMLLVIPVAVLGGPSVAIVDFTVPDEDAWSWAAKGLPDLLELELQSYDLTVVDRALIGALLSEHRMVQEGRVSGRVTR